MQKSKLEYGWSRKRRTGKSLDLTLENIAFGFYKDLRKLLVLEALENKKSLSQR